MNYILDAFLRQPDGSWLSIASTWFQGPNGRIDIRRGAVFVPGTLIEGLDVAAWLDEQSR